MISEDHGIGTLHAIVSKSAENTRSCYHFICPAVKTILTRIRLSGQFYAVLSISHGILSETVVYCGKKQQKGLKNDTLIPAAKKERDMKKRIISVLSIH